MKREPQAVLARHADAHAAPLSANLAALLLAFALVIALYHATFYSMLQVWWRSPTFAHGFLIAPISVWLAWRQRTRLQQLADQSLRPALAGLLAAMLLFVLLGMAWLLAELAHVQVMQQFAAIALLPVCALAMLGWQGLALLGFPLAYLFLCVPFGEVLLAPLIDFTASFTVTALQWSGVPVFREGSYFSLPTGNWSVVEACSGLRYLIASLALGALFAYLHFRHPARRLAVVTIALLLPILANGVRAYLIVMLGHTSGMRLAVGVDHLIYGWLFFGLLALLLYAISRRWREPALPPLPYALPLITGQLRADGARRAKLALLACLPLCAAWPALAWALERQAPTLHQHALQQHPLYIAPVPGWQRSAPIAGSWQAPMAGTPLQLFASEMQGQASVQLQLAWYARQTPSSELLARLDQPNGGHAMLLAERTRSAALPSGVLQVRESVLAQGGQRRLVWRLYRQGGVDTVNGALIKLLLARGKLLQGRQDGAAIIVSASYDELGAPPAALLQAYLAAALPAIVAALDQASTEAPHG